MEVGEEKKSRGGHGPLVGVGLRRNSRRHRPHLIPVALTLPLVGHNININSVEPRIAYESLLDERKGA